MKKNTIIAAMFALAATGVNAQLQDVPMEEGVFASDWASLSKWECPEWFKDAKFGLWAHWGPQCQAESGDWYARFMYYNNNPYDEHRGVHFNPSEYGLKEFCRDWKAAKWDPKAIVEKYKNVGCKYFFTLANHHDNFDLWYSPYQEWNSVNMGPKRDIVGEWAEAAREQGLKFGVSIHASHAWTWLEPSQQYDGNLTKEDGKGKWWEGYDPQELYAQRHTHSSGWENSGTIHSQWEWGNGASIPSVAYRQKLQNRCRQMVNTYNPDMLYFDDTVLPFWGCDNQWGTDFLAHYYNHMANRNDGADPSVVVMGKILPDEQKKAMLWDVERGIPDRPRKEYWQTCTCIGDWHYKKSIGSYKSAATVVRMLVDVISKNGNLLLSIPLNADGQYDSREAAVLDGIEAWMKVNGEGVYGTRMWDMCFGEGPLAEATNGMTAQGFNEGLNYTSEDVRYVTKDGAIYATIMAWPAGGAYTMKAFSPLAESYNGNVTSVELLGYGSVSFTQGGNGLTIDVPSSHTDNIAPVFRITFEENKQSDGELLGAIVSSVEDICAEMEPKCSDISSGKYSASKMALLKEAVAQAKAVDNTDEAAASAALLKLRTAYQNFMNNGMNPGGTFLRTMEKNLTASVLVEAENFSGTLGGRYGTLDNWTSENYSIDKGGDGIRKGLDNYGNKRGISIGVWDDRGSNKGDIANARIYRKVMLEKGIYYFGAAYNSLYGCNEKAYQFVSKELLSTEEIPSKSLAYYQVNTAKEGSELFGLYVEIKEPGEYYLGWQANMNNGSTKQEFRAIQVAFYSVADEDLRPISQKLSEGGWEKLSSIPSDMDFNEYYFAFVEHGKELPIVAQAHSDNGKNWGNVYVMAYDENANPCKNPSHAWVIEAFNADGNPAVGTDAKNWILTCVAEQNRQFRTEGWSKVVWQTYSDFGGSKGDNDSNRKLAFVLPEYSDGKGWSLKNVTSGAYIGAWDNVVENGQEFAANKSESDAAHFDIYRIARTEWMKQYGDLDNATEYAPVNISCLINNPSFERYDEECKPISWTCDGEGVIEKGYLPGCDNKLYMNNWQGSGALSNRSVSQVVKNLPAGKYRIVAYSICDGDGAILYADDNSVEMKHEGSADTSLDFQLAEVSDVTIGVRLQNYTSNNFKFDNIRLLYLGSAQSKPAKNIWVAPDGNDTNIGSQEQPLGTLQKALQMVRELRKNNSDDSLGEVHIIMKGGTYYLNSPVLMTADDSGTPESPTFIEAENGQEVVLSGGSVINNWQLADEVAGLPSVAQGHVWRAEIPQFGDHAVPFRQMWIGKNKMRRASTFDNLSMSRIFSVNKPKGELIVPRPTQTFAHADKLEMTIIQDWVTNVMRVEDIVSAGEHSIFRFKNPESGIEFKRPWPILRADASSSTNHMFYLSNAIELLNRPQEWFCDGEQGVVYYWPRCGETPDNTEAVVPVLETIVSLYGDGEKKVENIKFRGISFAHSSWLRPSESGHVPLQAGLWLHDAYTDASSPAGNVAWVGRPAAAVSVSNARSVSFEGCHFMQTASTALDFISGNKQMVVRGCTFSDIGGSAILAGFFGDENHEAHEPYLPENTDEVCDGIVIDNNYIAHPATEDWGCLGIGIGYASNVTISHNEIYDTPYSAISMGWGWTKKQNCMHDNHITGNYIHSFCNQMRDGGAIYTLSSQPNSSITENRIEDVGNPMFNPIMWEGMAHAQFDLYTDEGSDYFTVKDNWCERGEISKNQNGAHNTWGTNNKTVSSAIKQAAGLQPGFEAIRQMVTEQNLAPLDSISEDEESALQLSYPTPKVGGEPVKELVDGEEYAMQNSNKTLANRNLYWEWGSYLRTHSSGNIDDVTFIAHKHQSEGNILWSFEISSETGKGNYLGRTNGSNAQVTSEEMLWHVNYVECQTNEGDGFVLLLNGDNPDEGHELVMNGSADWVVNYVDGASTDKTAETTHWSFVRTADLNDDGIIEYNAAKLSLYQYLVEALQMCDRDVAGAAEAYDKCIVLYNKADNTTTELLSAVEDIKVVIASSTANYEQGVPATYGIVNPSFENTSSQHNSNSSIPFGWTMTKDGKVVTDSSYWAWCGANTDANDADGYYIWGVWHGGAYGNMELSQTVKGLPNGRWKLTARLMNNHTENGNLARIFADNNSMLAGDAGSYNTLPKGENCSFEGSWAESDWDLSHLMTVRANVKNGELTIGARSNGFFKIDDFKLTYLGDEETAIGEVANDSSQSGSIYDLTGRRVQMVKKGVYIKNGIKVIY